MDPGSATVGQKWLGNAQSLDLWIRGMHRWAFLAIWFWTGFLGGGPDLCVNNGGFEQWWFVGHKKCQKINTFLSTFLRVLSDLCVKHGGFRGWRILGCQKVVQK